MKVVCIDAYAFTGLTYGKVYDVTFSYENVYNERFITIINNNNIKKSYLKGSFITLEEFRDKKLKELGL